jgi:hypothetical protein
VESSWPIERQSRPAREPLQLLVGTPQAPSGYVLFIAAPTGFSIVERDEEPPLPDELLQLDGVVYRIVTVRRSPFPGDRRPCLVLEPQQ